MICVGNGGWPLILMMIRPQVRIQNVKGVVINKWQRLLFHDVMVGANMPHQRLCSIDQKPETIPGSHWSAKCSSAMSSLRFPAEQLTIESYAFGIAVNATAKTTSQS